MLGKLKPCICLLFRVIFFGDANTLSSSVKKGLDSSERLGYLKHRCCLTSLDDISIILYFSGF
jgi:hypothetical protein